MHRHSHSHDHGPASYGRVFAIGVALNLGFVVVEALYGRLSHSLALVAASYGLPQRNLGSVSVIGPLRMDYGRAIRSVRDAAAQLSSFVTEVYDER